MAREQSANNSLKKQEAYLLSLLFFFSVEANYVSQKDSNKSEKTFDYYQI